VNAYSCNDFISTRKKIRLRNLSNAYLHITSPTYCTKLLTRDSALKI
jgi:HKD family nuclease